MGNGSKRQKRRAYYCVACVSEKTRFLKNPLDQSRPKRNSKLLLFNYNQSNYSDLMVNNYVFIM